MSSLLSWLEKALFIVQKYVVNTISIVVVNQGTFSSTKLETLSNSLSRSKLAVSKAISRFLSRTSNSSKRFRIPWIISSWPFTFSCKRKEVFVTCALLCLSSFRYWGYIYRLLVIKTWPLIEIEATQICTSPTWNLHKPNKKQDRNGPENCACKMFQIQKLLVVKIMSYYSNNNS